MNRDEFAAALEAVLIVADQPLDHVTLAQAVDSPPADVERALHEMAKEYEEQDRGFELRSVGGGWRFYAREKYAPIVEKFVLEGQQGRLTQAALETMAVVAYKQPVSRSRISAIRGVNVDGVVRTLVSRGLIEELGTDGESGAILYGTTSYFLERLGLTSLDELPELAPFLPVDSELDEVVESLNPGSLNLEQDAEQGIEDSETAHAAAEETAEGSADSEAWESTGSLGLSDSDESGSSSEEEEDEDEGSESAESADSPDSPDSADSADSPDSPDSPDEPEESEEDSEDPDNTQVDDDHR